MMEKQSDFKKKADYYSDSLTFSELENMLKRLPCNIYLKDTECRYVFMSHYWHHLDFKPDDQWDIRGKTDYEIRKDKNNAYKALESDREVIRTGKGTSYVISFNENGRQEYLEIIKEPVFDEAGNVSGIVGLINDITESEMMKNRLKSLAMTDPLTGLKNRTCFLDEIDRIDKKRYPLVCISFDCDGLKIFNDTYGHDVGDDYIKMVSIIIQLTIPSNASLYRMGGDEFLAVLFNSDFGSAQKMMEQLRERCLSYELKDRNVSVSYGIAVAETATENLNAILAKADFNMYQNKSEKKKQAEKNKV